MILKWLVVLIFISPTLYGVQEKCIAATQAKGGTGLLMKALILISGNRPTKMYCHYDGAHFSPSLIDALLDEGGIPVIHLFSPYFTYCYLLTHHLDAKVILIFRDIRDAFVSYAYWAYKSLDLPIEEKLSLVFADEAYCEMSEHLSLFLDHPRFFVVRFEDLVGPQGGGDYKKQIQTLGQLAEYLNITLTEEEIASCAEKLFGNQEIVSGTFREGRIGSWKKVFREEHKLLFKERFGRELIRLGYVKDNDW